MRTLAAPKMGDDLFVFPSSTVHKPNRHPICTLKPRVSESQTETETTTPNPKTRTQNSTQRHWRVSSLRYFSWTSGVHGLLHATQNRDSAHDLCERRTAPPHDWTKPQSQRFGMTRAFHDPSRDFPDNSNKQFFCGSPASDLPDRQQYSNDCTISRIPKFQSQFPGRSTLHLS